MKIMHYLTMENLVVSEFLLNFAKENFDKLRHYDKRVGSNSATRLWLTPQCQMLKNDEIRRCKEGKSTLSKHH